MIACVFLNVILHMKIQNHRTLAKPAFKKFSNSSSSFCPKRTELEAEKEIRILKRMKSNQIVDSKNLRVTIVSNANYGFRKFVDNWIASLKLRKLDNF